MRFGVDSPTAEVELAKKIVKAWGIEIVIDDVKIQPHVRPTHQTNKEKPLQRLLVNGPPPLAACVSNSTGSVQVTAIAPVAPEASEEPSFAEVAWHPEPQLVEFEVDRNFICETLLGQEKDLWKKHLEKHAGKEPTIKIRRGSARNKSDWRPMLELPPVTAAYYYCNFGYIVLGHSGKKVISVYNCFHENVNFNIGRKVLMQHGFRIAPEKVSKVSIPREEGQVGTHLI